MNKRISANKPTMILANVFTLLGIANAIAVFALVKTGVIFNSSGDVFLVFLMFLYVVAVWVPVLIATVFGIEFNAAFVFAYEMYVFLAIVVGSLWDVYNYGYVYDKIIHFTSGVLFAMLGYGLFAGQKQNKATPLWLFAIAFSFAMMLGGVWEIIEFAFDTFLGENSQSWMGFVGRDVLKDTMIDIICDCAGGIIGGITVVLFERRLICNRAVKHIDISSDSTAEADKLSERDF